MSKQTSIIWTLETLTEESLKSIKAKLTSLPEVSPANPSQSQEKDKENTIKEIAGLTPLNAFALYDRDMHFWRTSQACLPLLKEEGHTLESSLELCLMRDAFSETWPKQGIMLDGVCWALTIVELRTGGNGGGLWPTPRNRMTGSVTPCRSTDKFNNLESVMARQIWPTPSNSMMTVGDMEQARFCGNDPKRPSYKEANKESEEVMGNLNPDWVEWLMGWPISWTSPEPLTELIWLDWEIDPADMEKPENYPSPMSIVDGKTGNQIQEWGKNRFRQQPFNKGNGLIPRVATGIKARVNRLKAIGNGQVPLCVKAAWEILSSEGK